MANTAGWLKATLIAKDGTKLNLDCPNDIGVIILDAETGQPRSFMTVDDFPFAGENRKMIFHEVRMGFAGGGHSKESVAPNDNADWSIG